MLQTDAVFSNSRVDTHALIQQFFGQTTLEGNTNALGNLTGVRCANVEANNLVSVIDDKDLDVGLTTIVGLLIVGPLKRLKFGVISRKVSFAVQRLGFIFTQTNAAVFKRSEHGCGNI